jgi:hypothetical protein
LGTAISPFGSVGGAWELKIQMSRGSGYEWRSKIVTGNILLKVCVSNISNWQGSSRSNATHIPSLVRTGIRPLYIFVCAILLSVRTTGLWVLIACAT